MTKLKIQQQILSWLGMYRDNLPIEAVHKLQDLLELQPQEECNHVSDGMVYTSNPPKYKCKKCGYMTTEYMAQEEKTVHQWRVVGYILAVIMINSQMYLVRWGNVLKYLPKMMIRRTKVVLLLTVIFYIQGNICNK